MLTHAAVRRRGKSEAERPFWISYADLMTAMMTLCLVVMAVTIISISRKLDKELSKITAPLALGGAPTVQTKGSALLCPGSPSLPSTPPL